jgi:hypothetical protein
MMKVKKKNIIMPTKNNNDKNKADMAAAMSNVLTQTRENRPKNTETRYESCQKRFTVLYVSMLK